MAQVEIETRNPRITAHLTGSVDKEEFSGVTSIDVPEALMSFAEEVRGNSGARMTLTTDLAMKDFGNGAGASVTIGMDCNQDEATMQKVFTALSQWGIYFAELHWKAADARFQQIRAERQQQGPPSFKP